LMCVVPPLGPTYIGESAKAYGLKVRCLHGEHVGEQVVNLGNSFLEPIRNFKGTLWEHIRKQGKLKKFFFFPLHPLS
jgi:hypothetical protein